MNCRTLTSCLESWEKPAPPGAGTPAPAEGFSPLEGPCPSGRAQARALGREPSPRDARARTECEHSRLGICGLGQPGCTAGAAWEPGAARPLQASPALLTFSVHSSCCGDRRQCRPTATVPTHSPAIVDPAHRPAADLSPPSRGGEGERPGYGQSEASGPKLRPRMSGLRRERIPGGAAPDPAGGERARVRTRGEPTTVLPRPRLSAQ